MNNDVYVTDDGGETWVIRGTGDFIGMTKSGLGIIGSCGQIACVIRTSIDKGQTFVIKGEMSYGFSFELSNARVVDNKVVLFPERSWEYPDENVFNLSTNSSSFLSLGGLTYEEIPKDIYLASDGGSIVGDYGLLMDDNLGYTRTYYGHLYPFYSIDGYEDLKIGVGEKTIVSNIAIESENVWNEVFDEDGNGFSHTFFKIRFISQNSFYVSGSNGLIYKATI
jgi:hypothetical protein